MQAKATPLTPTKWVWSGACVALVSMSALPASAVEPPVPTTKRFLSKSLNICDFGSFYVGGVPKVTEFVGGSTPGLPKQVTVGQMYVQFMIPEKSKSWPIIMVHGGAGYTGQHYEATEDGREGWMPYSVRKGVPFYSVDYAGLGRSGFDGTIINEAKASGNLSAIPEFYNFGNDDIFARLSVLFPPQPSDWGFFGHILPMGSSILNGTLIPHGSRGDPDPSSTHGNYPPSFPIDVIDPAIQARVGAIGPAPHPSNNKLLALQHYKSSLYSGPLPPGRNWTQEALAKLVERLGGAIIVAHSGGGIQSFGTALLLKQRGALGNLKGMIQLEAVSRFPAGLTPKDLDKVPFLFVKGDYFTTEFMMQATDFSQTIASLNASRTRTAGRAAYIALDDPAYRGLFKGVTHQMFADRASHDVFDVLAKWIDKNVSKSRKVSCPGGRDKNDDDDDHHRGRH